MNTSVTINLPEKLTILIKEAMQDEGLSESELIGKALDDYLFIRKFRKLRARMVGKTEANYSDEDIFALENTH